MHKQITYLSVCLRINFYPDRVNIDCDIVNICSRSPLLEVRSPNNPPFLGLRVLIIVSGIFIVSQFTSSVGVNENKKTISTQSFDYILMVLIYFLYRSIVTLSYGFNDLGLPRTSAMIIPLISPLLFKPLRISFCSTFCSSVSSLNG